MGCFGTPNPLDVTGDDMALEVVPISFSDACRFIEKLHRHHIPTVGHKFSIGVSVNDDIVGVAVVGRPIARGNDNGFTLEVTRLCTDGTKNAPSILYGACRRAAWALGYRRLITYTLPQEGGASLRASGFKLLGERGGGSWSRNSRPRIDKHPLEAKWLWESLVSEVK